MRIFGGIFNKQRSTQPTAPERQTAADVCDSLRQVAESGALCREVLTRGICDVSDLIGRSGLPGGAGFFRDHLNPMIDAVASVMREDPALWQAFRAGCEAIHTGAPRDGGNTGWGLFATGLFHVLERTIPPTEAAGRDFLRSVVGFWGNVPEACVSELGGFKTVGRNVLAAHPTLGAELLTTTSQQLFEAGLSAYAPQRAFALLFWVSSQSSVCAEPAAREEMVGVCLDAAVLAANQHGAGNACWGMVQSAIRVAKGAADSTSHTLMQRAALVGEQLIQSQVGGEAGLCLLDKAREMRPADRSLLEVSLRAFTNAHCEALDWTRPGSFPSLLAEVAGVASGEQEKLAPDLARTGLQLLKNHIHQFGGEKSAGAARELVAAGVRIPSLGRLLIDSGVHEVAGVTKDEREVFCAFTSALQPWALEDPDRALAFCQATLPHEIALEDEKPSSSAGFGAIRACADQYPDTRSPLGGMVLDALGSSVHVGYTSAVKLASLLTELSAGSPSLAFNFVNRGLDLLSAHKVSSSAGGPLGTMVVEMVEGRRFGLTERAVYQELALIPPALPGSGGMFTHLVAVTPGSHDAEVKVYIPPFKAGLLPELAAQCARDVRAGYYLGTRAAELLEIFLAAAQPRNSLPSLRKQAKARWQSAAPGES